MKRWIKRIIFICLVVGVLWVGVARFLSWQFAKRLPEWAADLSIPNVVVSVHEVHPGSCYTAICVSVGEVRLNVKGIEPVSVRDIDAEIPLRRPWQVHVRTTSEQAIMMDAVIAENRWDIKQCEGVVGQLRFSVTGNIDVVSEQGKLVVQTTGLKQFVHQVMVVPVWLDFLLLDGVQIVELIPQGGYLRLLGLPLIPLR